MKGASILKYFIAGMIFATVVAPILDSLTAVIMTALEAIKGKITVKITEYNYQIQNIGEDDIPPTRTIGFSAPAEEDDYDDND